MSEKSKESYWRCDECNRVLLHGEYRYNCTVCDDYDQCEQCLTTSQPPHPHKLARELAYGQAKIWECMKVDMATGIRAALAMYFDRHCMGTRDVDPNDPSTYTDTYSWFTFKTIGDRSNNFGHGLRQIIQPRDYLAICAANRPEWMITDFACIFQSIISVPIYTLFTDQEIAYVINNTKVSVVVCDKHMLRRFISMYAQCPSLKHIVCMDPVSESVPNGLSIHYMGDIERNGSMKKYEYVDTAPDDCLTITYTSGSSGFPKGVILSESVFRAKFPGWCLPYYIDRVVLSYRPLAWGADRNTIITVILSGGRVGFSTGNPSRLMEEIALVRPTYFSASPSIWNKIYSEFKTALALITAQRPPESLPDEENRILEQFSKLLPNRCKVITTGGAMTSPIVLGFITRCFQRCLVHDSYGISECGSVTYDNVLENSALYRLESIPEMNYTVDDQPFPRGELLIKTPQMFSGYMNNPEETRAAITDDGFFRTGDIVELWTDRFGRTKLNVIDRKKSFFKLAQGQFVSPEHLQNIYVQSPFVDQIYIHGDLLADSVYAVVVSSRQYAQAYALQHNLSDFDFDHPHPQFTDAVLDDLRSIARKEALRPHQIPSQIIIDFHPFTPENGLLTSSLKQCRPKLAAHYAHRFTKSNTLQQRLRTIIQTVTGKSTPVDDDEKTLVSVGGDSLAAVRLSRMIENDLGVSLPLNVLFDPTMNVQQLTALIQDPRPLSSPSILPQLIDDANVDLNIKVDGWKSSHPAPSTVLVTGSTGFVGAFLLAELLTSYPSGCKFVCLVRCDTSMDPIDRVRETMLFYQIWQDEYQHRIVALRGDLAQNHFGLDDETYESLNGEIDMIFHCGAGVNFILPYGRLYGPNVCGTREIIRFAAHKSSSCIPIQYISTMSVVPSDVEKEVCIDEIRADGLVSGYAQSKWVAEKLIWRASKIGVPVVIYRLGLICASSRTGACNPRDMYTLLFDALMKMNCYPESVKNGHMTGLPVDFTVKKIVQISRIGADVYGKIYHVFNTNDNIEFETIIDGMQRCGCVMESITDEQWKIKLNDMSGSNTPLESLGKFSIENAFRRGKHVVSADQFWTEVGGLNCPPLHTDYIFKWLNFILCKTNAK